MLANGETVIELLTRSKYLLSVSGEKWTDRQKTRAKILFRMFPKIKEAYTLICSLRSVFSNNLSTGLLLRLNCMSGIRRYQLVRCVK